MGRVDIQVSKIEFSKGAGPGWRVKKGRSYINNRLFTDSYKKYGIDGWKGPRPDQTPGTRGGRSYKNYDKTLPQTDGEGNDITYREFDVNNKIEGQNRDAERFIIGSDGSIYYTNDHYQTFIKIRGE